MLYTLSNEFLTITIDSMGATPRSITSKEGLAYLTDPAIQSSPFLFPFVGRHNENRYTYKGSEYEITIHGFIRNKEFTLQNQSKDSLTLLCNSDFETLQQYPFPFSFSITYSLQGQQLNIEASVTNTGTNAMYYGFGFHPAFNAPMTSGQFSDCYLSFPNTVGLEEQIVAPSKQVLDKRIAFQIEDKKLHLTYELFDNDARILYGTGGLVKLEERASNHSVTITYEDIPQLVIWQRPKTKGKTICLEPCTSLPAFEGKTTELTEKKDLIRLEANTNGIHSIGIVFD
jgi:galactose mutarotase-like enzyme